MPFATPAQPISEVWAYFNKRIQEMGFELGSADLEAHGIQLAPPERLWDYGIRSKLTQGRHAILFQYINEFGNKLDIFQARMIGGPPDNESPPKGMSLERWNDIRKDMYPKYIGSGGLRYDLYFPLLSKPWMDLEYMFITEGIPKAIKACRSGIPCASIQGKDMFQIKNTDLLVPGLERLLRNEKLKRITYICDSDAGTKQDIRNSAVKLVGILNGRRQARDFADYAILPDLPDVEKTGLDDYLNSQGPPAFIQNLVNWIITWEGGKYENLMTKLNAVIAWIRGTTNYVDKEHRRVMSQSATNILTAPIVASAGTLVNPYTSLTIPAAKASLTTVFDRDPFKSTATSVDFWPGMEEWLPDGQYNLWKDASPEEIEGNLDAFLTLAQFTIIDAKQLDLLLQLIAHRIRYPSEKSPLMVFLYGGEGTGKTCLATSLFSAITTNADYKYIGELSLGYGHENSHTMKQAVCMEEPSRSGMTNKDMEHKLKIIGDAEYLKVNQKGIDQYNVRNRALFWINSNEHYLPVSGAARRWLILESPAEKNDAITKAAWDWLNNTTNAGGILRKYLKDKYQTIDAHVLRRDAELLESKGRIVTDNRHPALAEYESVLETLPEALLELGCVPTKVLYSLPPYSLKQSAEIQIVGRTLGVEYPLVEVGNPERKVRIRDGVTTTFRVVKKHDQMKLDPLALRDIYAKWEAFTLNRKY